MSTILITGASSGLGLAFLRHYASIQPAARLIAIDVSPFPTDFADLPSIEFYQIDITSESSLNHLADQLKNRAIDLLIHSAGIRGLVSKVVKEKRGDVAATETYEVMNKQTMMKTFEINSWGTFNLIKSLLPNLRLSSTDWSIPKVVILSSRMGSVSSNVAGGGYAYRASKAALNAVVKSFSIDVPDVIFLLLHPGRVETGLVEWREEGAISAEESVRDCMEVVDKLEKKDSGTLVDRWGAIIEW